MSTSIYYTASRSYPLTSSEQRQVQFTVEQHNQGYMFPEAETLGFWDAQDESEILTGSVALPNEDETGESVEYWLDCLTVIRSIVKDADWDVTMDDIDIPWDDDEGYILE